MGTRQWLIIIGAMLCNLADGYDLSVVAFALPHLPDGFASPAMKGWIASMGLVGMAVGAIGVAPLADRFGRRPVILGGVVLNMVAVGLTGLAMNASTMLVTRFFTGVAVGILGSLSVLIAQEFSSRSKRNLATGLVTVGFSAGSLLGGLVGLLIIDLFNGAWQVFFFAGVLITGVVLVYVVVLLPESISFLAFQETLRAQHKIQRIVESMRLEGVDVTARPPTHEPSETKSNDPERSLLSREFRTRTLLLWFGYMLANAGYYFIATWTPQLITDSSGSETTGTTAGTVVSLGALVGAVIFGLVGMKVLSTKLAWMSLFISMIAQIVFALTLEGGMAMVMAAVLGMAAFASLTSFVSSAPQLYPVLLRGKGLGYMYGLSRIGAISAPLAAGYAIAVMSAESMYLAASGLFGIAGVMAFFLWRNTRTYLVAERQAAESPDPQLV